MKYGVYLLLTLSLTLGAFFMAQNKIQKPLALDSIHLGMSVGEIQKSFGTPFAETRNHFTYILDDGSELLITLRDEKVSSATVKFHRKIQIQDPDMKKLTLVQMEETQQETSNPSWFFAGKPEEGLIYKITSDGIIESLTWVPPFSYGSTRPKQLQALLRDFNSQRSM
jgi:hypothetical protein